MLRSLYSGISGMKVNQTKLDVIGNNIANVSTTGFKSQRARFSTTLSQTSKNASAPSINQGGINASQVGLGVQLASIDSVMTNGNLQSTGRALDVAIDQTGYFVVSKGPVVSGDSVIQVSHTAGNHSISSSSLSSSGSSLKYTRDGSFVLDQEGNLLTSDGYRVMGYSVTNDDSTQEATAQRSGNVSAAGLNFVFGPGSQLNNYKVILGTIAEGTSTTATVDKNTKEIIVNGDFSTTSALTAEAVQTAINLGLSGAGISQTVSVTGSVQGYSNLTSEKIVGGSEKSAPGTIAFAGYTIAFNEGANFNGYTFKTTDAGGAAVSLSGTDITLDIKTIKDQNMTNDALLAAINAQVSGLVKKVTGSLTSSATTGMTSDATAGGTDGTVPSDVNAFGVTLSFDTTNSTSSILNDYKIVMGKMSSGTTTQATVDTKGKTITVDADFVSGNLTDTDVVNAINEALSKKGITEVKLDTAKATGAKVPTIADSESDTTYGGTPVQSISGDGEIYFVSANATVNCYDGSLKSLKIPDTVKVAGSTDELSVVSYTIQTNGIISAVLEDGSCAALGQIAMATFKNQEGLTRESGNLFSTSVNSGDPILRAGVNTTGEDNSLGFGDFVQNYLEMSNVDLAEQFTDMITATRAFQASSKMINTGDEILQDIINLVR